MRKRLQAKLKAVKTELKRRMHDPIPEVGKWLRLVVSGHISYYGVPLNGPALTTFRTQVGRLWQRVLSRRSRKGQVCWERMQGISTAGCPRSASSTPIPRYRLRVTT